MPNEMPNEIVSPYEVARRIIEDAKKQVASMDANSVKELAAVTEYGVGIGAAIVYALAGAARERLTGSFNRS